MLPAPDPAPPRKPVSRALSKLPSIRLPRTATRRGAICFVQVLTGIDPRPVSGAGFDGSRYAAGALISEEDLAAGREGDPVVFEATEIEGTFSERSRRKWEALYILWRYRRDLRLWEEIARVTGNRGYLLGELRVIAARALRPAGFGLAPTARDAAELIRAALDRDIAKVDAAERGAVLAILFDLVSSWMVGEQRWGFFD